MRMHTALHLLSSLVEGSVTGGQIGIDKSRLDFDLPDPRPAAGVPRSVAEAFGQFLKGTLADTRFMPAV